ncbi:ABC transporter permease [Pseudonocardia xinjiangensis]|uniref:ABC transporter permease n=1 Tax=Pseudonocardia xinjiangensis TaxID=75289 RepID=A0ABX1REP1_9PSEU|nr:ABC transporter permease [Pseudonocardia xinjiangensis]NMH78870.1 ABC transporter permease [Pseudonocardia xinjiangensis]
MSTVVSADPLRSSGLRARFRKRIPQAWRTPLGVTGAAVAALWILVAVLGPVLWPYGPLAQDFPRLEAPSGAHWFGTDELGRDVFTRVLAGAQVTVPLALLLVGLSVVVGGVLGLAAGFFGRWVDETVMRLTDLVMAFPIVILAMVVAAALGASLVNAVLAALVVSWPAYARVTRGLVVGVRTADYVLADRLLGFSALRSLRTDIVPMVVGPVLILATLDIGTATLLLSGLSFLGLGAKPPTAEWGSMVSTAVQNFDSWWLGVFPGLAILTVVMAFNFLGDALRDAVDPRTAGVLGKAETR